MQEKKSTIKNTPPDPAFTSATEAETSPPEGMDPTTAALCQRVRELRRQQGWTLEQLAASCRVSRSMLSQIERGQANPTLAVANRIAGAFGMSLGQFIDAPPAGGITLIRANDPAYLFRDDADCRIHTLSPLDLEKQVEFYAISIAPGKALRSAPHYRGAQEIFTCHRGQATIRSGEQITALGPGDAAHYRADLEHAIENTGRQPLVGYLVVTYTAP